MEITELGLKFLDSEETYEEIWRIKSLYKSKKRFTLKALAHLALVVSTKDLIKLVIPSDREIRAFIETHEDFLMNKLFEIIEAN